MQTILTAENKTEKVCAICTRFFVAKRKAQKLCSRSCAIRNAQSKKPLHNSEEQKRKISISLKGRPATWRHKIAEAQRGSKHWNWKGGISPANNAARSCIELKEWRRKVFARDKYTCVLCGYKGKGLEADHIKGWSEYPEHRFDVSNGRTLCKPCHSLTPNYRGRRTKHPK